MVHIQKADAEETNLHFNLTIFSLGSFAEQNLSANVIP